jgi:phosphoglycolate phosphatase-like HAD superfamily hydrolase
MFDSQKTVNPNSELENLRILLWDIDGTLMRSTVQGGYLKYFSATMRKVFGSAGTLSEIVPSGMTDTQIMYEALRGENFTPEQIFERKDELLKVFQAEMKTVLDDAGEPYEMLGGAREILTETAINPRFVNALLTGNLSVAAQAKLESVGLWHYFENAPNAFGEISHDRRELAREAGKLFNERYDYNFKPEQFIVLGDTPNDIDCARAFGAKVVAVATGKNQTKEKLAEQAPNIVIDDLTDTAEILRILDNL